MSDIFKDWNKGVLDSYLIEITADILAYKDSNNEYEIDQILDSAGQKGTGKWTVISASELGQPASVIAEALLARFASALTSERQAVARALGTTINLKVADQHKFIKQIASALYCSKIISYTQGYMLLKAASKDYNWQIDYGSIAGIWTGGCIIRSRFLGDIQTAFKKNPDLENLLLDDFFNKAIKDNQQNWRQTVSIATLSGVAIPGLASALTFFDSIRNNRLGANLIQAQRDYFGAHTYEKIDKPRGQFFHTNWTGEGGNTTATSYTA
jgi:6-phosphogluconate dehydrogenase